MYSTGGLDGHGHPGGIGHGGIQKCTELIIFKGF